MLTNATEVTGAMHFQLAAFEQANCLLEQQQEQISALQGIVERQSTQIADLQLQVLSLQQGSGAEQQGQMQQLQMQAQPRSYKDATADGAW